MCWFSPWGVFGLSMLCYWGEKEENGGGGGREEWGREGGMGEERRMEGGGGEIELYTTTVNPGICGFFLFPSFSLHTIANQSPVLYTSLWYT